MTTTAHGVLTMGGGAGVEEGGTQATCGKQPRLAPWSRDQPALSGTPDSCGFPEGNNRMWQCNQPGLSPWRRGSRQLSS